MRVTVPEGPKEGHATARVKVSPQLDAAIRAEARAAAREEIRERFRSRVTVNGGGMRFVVKGNAGRGVGGMSARQSATPETVAAMLSMLEKAWQNGGPERARALLELCLPRESTAALNALMIVLGEQARMHGAGRGRESASGMAGGPPEHARGQGNAFGRAHVGSTSVDVMPVAHSQGNATGHARPEGTAGDRAGGAHSTGNTSPSAQDDGSAGPREHGNAIVQTAPGGGPGTGDIAPVPGTPAAPASSAGTPIPGSGVGPSLEQPGRVPAAAGPEALPPGGSMAESAGTSASRNSGVTSSRQLPFTGVELPLVALLGAAALAAGALLRRRSAPTVW